jgi:short subunit dehydrogenase
MDQAPPACDTRHSGERREREDDDVVDLFDLTGKVAVVTGGTRGIGLMIARGLLDAGATVYISSRKAAAGDVTGAVLPVDGGIWAAR